MENSDVFDIRNEAKDLSGQDKIQKLLEGLNRVKQIYQNGYNDEWTDKALAWTLIDLCKAYIQQEQIDVAAKYFQQLSGIEFYDSDEIIENQIKFLRPQIDQGYAIIKRAEDLSKNGNPVEAMAQMKQIIASGQLKPIHHETYGWVIYRFLKAQLEALSSIEVRTCLRDYMNLTNERPSMLHSMILNFGLNFSKSHDDFNLLSFFKLWGVNNLRYEDLHESYIEDSGSFETTKIPSLISRIFRELIQKKYDITLEGFTTEFTTTDFSIDWVREPLFWQLYDHQKNKRVNEFWELTEEYLVKYNYPEGSIWHSKVLSLCERTHDTSEGKKFYDFFKAWNPNLLMDEDWKDVEKDENTYRGLAIKALKKAFEYAKESVPDDLDWLIDAYDNGVKKLPNDEWLKRELGILLSKTGRKKDAIKLYKKLALDLNDQYYFWKEFSELVDEDLKYSMLCKAALLQSNDDFLGDVRLALAQIFKTRGLYKKAGIELLKYKKNRVTNSWNLAEGFDKLIEGVDLQEGNNVAVYREACNKAERFAFEDLEWLDLVLIEKFRDNQDKERLLFSNGSDIEIAVRSNFVADKNPKIGSTYQFKLRVEVEEHAHRGYRISPIVKRTYKPLVCQKSDKPDWEGLEKEFAVIDYVNTKKSVIHAITFSNEEVFFRDDIKAYAENDIIQARKVTRNKDGESRIDLFDVKKLDDRKSVETIEPMIAFVDGVNEDKSLFHVVVDSKIHSVIKYTETDLRPAVGNFLRVRLLSKLDKKRNEKRYKVLSVEETDEVNPSIAKEVSGMLRLKFKMDGQTYDLYDLDETDLEHLKPSFAFIDDYYIPRHLLVKYRISSDESATAKVVKDGHRWKAYDLIMKS